ncbi:M20/M25/M40 family metallo-hydrolase [Paenibacillus sp. sptzw28]|uniref:M20/M25/M40 family metallo-hydrolase n=1 Tax=Paenibacillus sp. sptzw28 TaxID=715179 RepID=UPI001C6F5719|nr:M20/M25/M40 family metallo-hydrolase [Paenibacillus sp. sptzw28]QYR19182.1 M20/M25/M40 family metallo-hydrolase [Paenibacillus sp. sptzw28]
MLQCRDDVLFYTKMLVRIKSIVNTSGEKEIAQTLYSLIASLPYFQQNPSFLTNASTIDDEVERYNVMAFVKGTKEASGRTVILMGHIDTVGIDDYNQLESVACEPDQLREAMLQEELPEEIRKHVESEDWLFGRGALDMKSGIAGHFYLLKHYAEHPEELTGNLVFLAECDEEDRSHGILSALKQLKAWKDQHQFDYIAAINADFVAPRYPGDPNRYIYKGTVGKLLPAFYITGAETHVGACFEGLDPNFLAAELTRQLSYNPELCNSAQGEITVPPVSLKQTDFKPAYSVQTALSAYVYYNMLVYTWTPKEVLEKLKRQAEIAFDNALSAFGQRYREYCRLSGEPPSGIPWRTRVFTYEEMNKLLLSEHGQHFAQHMAQFKQQLLLLDRSLDLRMYAARVVEEAWKWMKDKSPAMILFFASLYSPRVELTGKNRKEQRLIEAVDGAVAEIRHQYEHPIQVKPFFPYISDMSFVSLSDDEEAIQTETANNPAWKSKLHVDYQDIRDLDVPVINIGPYGHDAHKKYERMEITYSLSIVPNLTNLVIRRLLAPLGSDDL